MRLLVTTEWTEENYRGGEAFTFRSGQTYRVLNRVAKRMLEAGVAREIAESPTGDAGVVLAPREPLKPQILGPDGEPVRPTAPVKPDQERTVPEEAPPAQDAEAAEATEEHESYPSSLTEE